MLATIGFLLTGIFLAAFAYSFLKLTASHKQLAGFGWAYGFVAIAFIAWGLIASFSSDNSLPLSVLIGDGLVLAASIACLLVVTPLRQRPVILTVTGFIAIVLLIIRDRSYYPQPYLKDGILFFNTQRPIAIGLSAIIVAIWLPAAIKVARTITAKKPEDFPWFVSAYALPIVTAALFIQARRRSVIIESFVAFGLSILLLLISNSMIKNKMGEPSRAAK